ncbi:hypothetical protein DPMN_051040 [Dreissena polymorpha]|uniref:Uncharacterized protein n=1 Tax=Dreissena polymorpha TaxID=45954 RepID=A0A9D4CH69_DREPO|nr:hypothetical protein DPMN_051040 [Dreissena polymorpha]
MTKERVDQFEYELTRVRVDLVVIPSVRQNLDNFSLEYYFDDLPSPGTLQADIECWRWNVKTNCRSTMGEERLTGLCLMSVHRDIHVNVSDIVKQFARQNPSKMKLPCILEYFLSNDDNDLS